MTVIAPRHIRGPRRRGGDQQEMADRTAWVIAKSQEGCTPHELASAIGVSLTSVRRILVERGERRTIRRASQPLSLSRSFSTEFREGLSDDVRGWLLENCPRGVTMGQFVASIVTDAHAEETENLREDE